MEEHDDHKGKQRKSPDTSPTSGGNLRGIRQVSSIRGSSASNLCANCDRKPSVYSSIILSVFLIISHFGGGAIIMYADGTESRQVLEAYTNRCRTEYDNIIDLLHVMSNETNNLTEIEAWVELLDDCHRNAVHPMSALPTDDYYNAALLAFTIYTTIGYGTVTATSFEGQLICVLYAFLVCPLFFALVGESILFVDYLSTKFIAPIPVNGTSTTCHRYRLAFAHYCTTPFALSLIFTLINLLIGSFILIYWKGWSMWENVYFLFQSISLIGFGDYFVHNQTPWAFLIPWITVGIATLMVCERKIQMVWQMASNRIRKYMETCALKKFKILSSSSKIIKR